MAVTKYEIKFRKFLDDHKVLKGSGITPTHTAVGDPFKSYRIEDTELDKFIKLYSKVLTKTDMNLHITERPKEIAPLCVDIDWHFDENHVDRQYTEEHIMDVVEATNKILFRYFKIKKQDLKAFVFEKDGPSYDREKKETKDGFHIMYPYIPVNKNMRYLILEELDETIIAEKIFDDLDYLDKGDDSVVDRSIVWRNGWMMYGSYKAPWNRKMRKVLHGKKYTMTNVYDYRLMDYDMDEFTDNMLPSLLSVRKFGKDDQLELNNDINKQRLTKELQTVLGKYEKVKAAPRVIKRNYVKPKTVKNQSKDDQAEEARELLGLLKKERSVPYLTWAPVGWTLYNISPNLYDDWIAWSKQPGKEPDYDGCLKEWETAARWRKKNPDKAGTGLSTLKMWAKKDNHDGYMDFLRTKIKPFLTEAESGTPWDIAKVAYELWKDKYVCASLKHDIWFEFQSPRWVEIEKGYSLSMKISDELVDEFVLLIQLAYTESQGAEGIKRDAQHQRADKLSKIVKKLKTTSFKSQILAECSKIFYVPKFIEKLDENRDLLGFDNGVYDLSSGRFREGSPEDYLSFTVGYDYEEFNMKDEKIKDITKYFEQVQTEKDMRDYVLCLMASYLDGHNKQQKFIIWTGSGANSKSVSVNFLQRTLGDYAGTFKSTVLTMKRGDPGGATPYMADKRGKRFVVINEPEGDDKINVGCMKELSGGDKVTARKLYADEITFYPQFKMILVCNKLPQIPATDGGTWRRIRVTPWESQFLDHDKKIENPKKQFYKDFTLEDRMESWSSAFMWLLLKKYYPMYKKGKVKEPKKVTEHTEKYQRDSDLFHEYIDNSLNVTKKKEDYESLSVVFTSFKEWYEESYGQKRSSSKKEIREYFQNHKYVVRGDRIFGIKFKRKGNIDTSELD